MKQEYKECDPKMNHKVRLEPIEYVLEPWIKLNVNGTKRKSNKLNVEYIYHMSEGKIHFCNRKQSKVNMFLKNTALLI